MDKSDHRVKHKSRRSSSNSLCKKKKSRKRSSSSSGESVRVSSHKKSSSKDKKKSRRRKHRTSSRESSSSDSCAKRLKLGTKPRQLLGERPEFCKNSSTKHRINGRKGESLHNSNRFRSPEGMRRRDERSGTSDPRENFSTIERRVLGSLIDEIGKKRRAKERLDGGQTAKKSKKSRKRRSPSSSSYSSDASSCGSSSTSSDSDGSSDSSSDSSSSSDSHEKRKKRKRRKRKKLAKKIKREVKKRREEKRKLKRLKEKSKTPVKINEKEIKRIMEKVPQDRLLKDINVELADRARAMAPMTREQWEKKQSVIRRVYDDETGRQRLIKGDGEILEEIVSRDRHMAINRKATKGDGDFFQSRLRTNK